MTNFLPRRSAACPRHAQRPAGAQAGDELASQRATALDVERLVDGLVGDPHGLIIGEVDRSRFAICSGLHDFAHRRSARRPWRRPIEAHGGPGDQLPVGPVDLTGEPVLHVVAEPVVADELRQLRAARSPLGVPLGGRRPVVHRAAARRRVAAQLPRDRRRMPDPPGGRSPAPQGLRCAASRSPRARRRTDSAPTPGQLDGGHPATMAEPPRPDRRRHPHRARRVLRRETLRDIDPKRSVLHRAVSAADPETASPAAPSTSPSTQQAVPYNTSTSGVLRRPVESELSTPVDVPLVGGVAVGVLRMVASAGVGDGSTAVLAGGAGPQGVRRRPRCLRLPAGPRRAGPPWDRGRRGTGSASYGPFGSGGVPTSAVAADHHRRRRAGAQRPSGRGFHGGSARPAVRGRHHVHPHLGRLAGPRPP